MKLKSDIAKIREQKNKSKILLPRRKPDFVFSKMKNNTQIEIFLEDSINRQQLKNYLLKKFKGGKMIRKGLQEICSEEYLLTHVWPNKKCDQSKEKVSDRLVEFYDELINEDKILKEEILTDPQKVSNRCAKVFFDRKTKEKKEKNE